MERIDPLLLSPHRPHWLNLCTESEVLPCLTIARETLSNRNTLIIHCASIHHRSEGASTAAYAPLSHSSFSFAIDHAESSTPYEAEMVVLWLASRLAKSLQSPETTDIDLFSPSLQTVTTLLDPSRPTTGKTLRRALWDYLIRFNSTATPGASVPCLHVRWCPANQGLADSEKALDLAEKALTSPTPSSSTIPLPFSVQAAKAEFKRAKRRLTMTSSPSETDLNHLMRGFYDPTTTIKALSALPRTLLTMIVQLRAGHSPLNAHLFWCKRAVSPDCELCGWPWTVEHYPLICRRYNQP